MTQEQIETGPSQPPITTEQAVALEALRERIVDARDIGGQVLPRFGLNTKVDELRRTVWSIPPSA